MSSARHLEKDKDKLFRCNFKLSKKNSKSWKKKDISQSEGFSTRNTNRYVTDLFREELARTFGKNALWTQTDRDL